jgi:AbrB family looped-hinge helix DNA binding protein
MKTTIDKAGRVVIPAGIRERAGLRPGMELEVTVDDLAIHLVPSGSGPRLVRRGQRLVAEPVENLKDLPKINLAAMVEEERNRWPW